MQPLPPQAGTPRKRLSQQSATWGLRMHKWERVKMGKWKWVMGTQGGRKEGKEGGDLSGNILWTGGLRGGVLRPGGGGDAQGSPLGCGK